jgi:hypothetical protein
MRNHLAPKDEQSSSSFPRKKKTFLLSAKLVEPHYHLSKTSRYPLLTRFSRNSRLFSNGAIWRIIDGPTTSPSVATAEPLQIYILQDAYYLPMGSSRPPSGQTFVYMGRHVLSVVANLGSYDETI